jgi:hypothetical protein
VSAVTVRLLVGSVRAYVDTPHTASIEMRRMAAEQLSDRWSKAPALVRIITVIRVVRRFW